MQFNTQVMKQMRKIEYALLQQKKQQQAQANGSAGGHKTTAVAQQISINNTQNNTIIAPNQGLLGDSGQQQLSQAQKAIQNQLLGNNSHKQNTSGGPSVGVSGNGSNNNNNKNGSGNTNQSSSHHAKSSKSSVSTFKSASNNTNGTNNNANAPYTAVQPSQSNDSTGQLMQTKNGLIQKKNVTSIHSMVDSGNRAKPSKHQRVHSDGNQMMQSMFHSYSGRIPSLGGIKHKRGKSGQIG